MQETQSHIEELMENVEEYVATSKKLIRLEVAEKTSEIVAELVSFLVLVAVFILVFIFLNIALAFVVSSWIGKPYSGFLVIGLLDLVLGILLASMKDKWMKTPLMNKMIKNFFKDKPL